MWTQFGKLGQKLGDFMIFSFYVCLSFARNSIRPLSFVIPRKPRAVSAKYFTVVLSTRHRTDLETWTSAA